MPNIVKNLWNTLTFNLEEGMMEFLVMLIMIAVLDLAAMRWGAISLDGPDSPEWKRRRHWLAFH